ncbi:hypothetical protein D3C72_2124330 [compost metagenome]
MGQYLTAVYPSPMERIVRHAVVLAPADLGRHEGINTRFAQNLRQSPAVPKNIRQPQILAFHAELFPEELRSVQNLAYK